MTNTLYFGDNLDVLRRYIADESVDLVYLDPPFNSDQNYNVLFAEQDGTRSAAQIHAFEDTWKWDEIAARAYQEVVECGDNVADALIAFRTVLHDSDMLAYLSMMAPRLKELHRVLKPTGSLYLHCDPTASHYLKVLMDSVFSPANYRNEITWQRTNAHNDAKRWSEVADIILYYGKSNDVVWNTPRAGYDEEYLRVKYRHDDNDGRGPYRLDNMTSPHPRPNMMYEWKGHASPPAGWRYSRETMEKLDSEGRVWYPNSKAKRPQLKRYLSEGKGPVMGCVWTDISPLNSQAAERLGYPTQKPEALLERIILASSNEDDTVLDPFCGCGTSISAAQRLNRQWVGIDVTALAISLIKNRLLTAFGDCVKETYKVIGEPVSLADARALAEQDKYQFQWWALGLVNARPVEEKKGADKGIDGRILFHDEPTGGKTKQIILSVKGGHLQAGYVRDLRGVIEREQSAIGVLISMEQPTGPMRKEAASAGFYKSPYNNQDYPRLQILTVEELLEGKGIDAPLVKDTRVQTIKAAPRAKGRATHTQKGLLDE
jgi:DNA modification methylase